MQRFVVTGANRGIGLELVRQLLERGDVVEATAREPQEATALMELASDRLRIHRCDVRSDESVHALGIAEVDVLVNNAGVMQPFSTSGLEEMDLRAALDTFDVNALGAIRVTRALLPQLRRGTGRKIVHMSSDMGSIGENQRGGAYAYRMSKAALNMAARTMALDLRADGIVCVAMHPGWVQTDMGGERAPTSVEESVKGLLAVIDGLSMTQSGSFVDYRGATHHW